MLPKAIRASEWSSGALPKEGSIFLHHVILSFSRVPGVVLRDLSLITPTWALCDLYHYYRTLPHNRNDA